MMNNNIMLAAGALHKFSRGKKNGKKNKRKEKSKKKKKTKNF